MSRELMSREGLHGEQDIRGVAWDALTRQHNGKIETVTDALFAIAEAIKDLTQAVRAITDESLRT